MLVNLNLILKSVHVFIRSQMALGVHLAAHGLLIGVEVCQVSIIIIVDVKYQVALDHDDR
jgi:hypothetical protein